MITLRITAVSFILLAAAPASAVNPKELIESCRNSVGKPIFMACKGGGGSPEACREKAKPKVQACVQAAMEKSLAKQAAPKAEETPTEADIAKVAPTSLVAPPRTVSDVTAILDQQKPDSSRTAPLRVAADAEVPNNLKGLPLADFYYKRGQARALLGRNDEALAAHRKDLALTEKLVAADPRNAEWQRDLSITFERIGAVLLKIGRRAEAVDAFRRALAIRETLAAADAGNALWQTDLVISLVQVARLGDDPRARLTRALDITQRLDRERKLNANQKGWIGMIGQEVARLPR